MQITFSPMRADTALILSRTGDLLTVNGDVFDFSVIPEGATLPRDAIDCAYIASDVTRCAGVIKLTLILPHGADAPPETLFPQTITLDADGLVDLPPFTQAIEETPA